MAPRRAAILHRLHRAFGPAIAAVSAREALRAGLGAATGLAVAGLMALGLGPQLGLRMIAPFGASAVLIFAVPNSPLAQPWSAIMGNTVGALVGVAACLTIPDPIARVAVAVGVTIVGTSLARAVHPPAGAVAMTAALAPQATAELGFRFALVPVALGTAVLVLAGIAYARATGRRYPFRQFDDPSPHGTADPQPVERLGLTEAELADILSRYRQSLNLGVEDLARLIGAAEMQAASHAVPPSTAADIMSRDLVTVGPGAPLAEVAALFRRHRFTSLPVVEDGDRLLGVIFQRHLIAPGAPRRLRIGLRPPHPARAAAVMATATPSVPPDAPIGALLPLLAQDNHDAVPVMEGGRIVGIVTQTDLIAALARQSLRGTGPAEG